MTSHRRFAAALAAAATLAIVALTGSPATAANPSTDAIASTSTEPAFATVAGGELMGARIGGVYSFKGVPYAQADRFEPAQPTAWTDTRSALNFGEICPNGATTVNAFDFASPSGHDQIENEQKCLNLNIWSPTQEKTAEKPVLVWIHGGGLASGSSAESSYYEGQNFARDEDAVVVSVNHRVNALGYLDLSAYGAEYAATGNNGQLDLVAALQWVQDNIEQFGGDPDNVTIMGHSGGANKVGTLMAMPAAVGLFDKAIAMSGPIGSISQESSRGQAAALMAELGVGSVDELRAVPYAELAAAAAATGFAPDPVVDGVVLPAPAVTDGVFSPLSDDVPLLVSNNFGEVSSNIVAMTAWENSSDALGENYRPATSAAQVDERLTAVRRVEGGDRRGVREAVPEPRPVRPALLLDDVQRHPHPHGGREVGLDRRGPGVHGAVRLESAGLRRRGVVPRRRRRAVPATKRQHHPGPRRRRRRRRPRVRGRDLGRAERLPAHR
jgi:para-nitrobenzyl esterase